jgi:hypothetical protein
LTVNEANGTPIATSMGSTGTLSTNTVQYTLSSYFTNPAGAGSITYSLVSNPYGNASISSGILSVTGNNRGTSYTVTVRGTNSYGSADSSLSVTESSPPSFWTEYSTGASSSLYVGYASSSGTFGVAAYGSSTFYTSTTGTSWTARTLPASGLTQSIVGSGSTFICGTNGTGATNAFVYKSTNSGSSWSRYDTGYILSLTSVVFFSPSGTYIFGTSNTGYSLSFDPNNNGSVAYTIGSGTRAYPRVATNGSMVVAVGPSGYSAYTLNGVTWTESSSSISTCNGIAYSPSQGAFVATSSSRMWVSYDGFTWTGYTVTTRSWRGISWNASLGQFLVISTDSNVVMTSSNGTSWTESTVTNARSWWTVVGGGSKWIAGSSDNSGIVGVR